APIPRAPQGSIVADGLVTDWAGLKPVILDPVNDNLLRDFQAAGDIRAIYACRDAANLYVRIDTFEPVSDRVDFRLGLRYFGDSGREEAGGSYKIAIRPGGQITPASVRAAVRDNRSEEHTSEL